MRADKSRRVKPEKPLQSLLEMNHPFWHAFLVKSWIWIGKAWLHMLVNKDHLWTMASAEPLRHLMFFGPASQPLRSASAPILVLAGGASGRSKREAVGETELSVERPD
jgi:hypothetical protein